MRVPLRRTLTRLALAAAVVCAPAAAQAPLDVRIALVIGNSRYTQVPSLANPTNDAVAMAARLKQLGFTVIEVHDGSRDQMRDAIAVLKDRLRGKQGVGMFYYAGHGLQLDWHNYMVPVDARIGKSADVDAQSVGVDAVLVALRDASSRMNILVLDACRDNPFTGASSGKGLAQMDAPPGTFLAYATAPGNVAEDGEPGSSNGLYTRFLLDELQRPGQKIEDIFKRVRLQVRQRSSGRQVPWESTSLEEDFVFNARMRAEDLEKMAVDAARRQQDLLVEAGRARERERVLTQELEAEHQRQAALAKQVREAQEAEERRKAEEAKAEERRKIEDAKAEERRKAEDAKLQAQAADAQARAQAEAQAQAQALARAQAAEAQAKERERQRAEALRAEQARRAAEEAAARAREQQLAREREEQVQRVAALEAQRRAEQQRQQELERARAAPPPSPPASEQDAFTREKQDWDRIASSTNADDYYEFLKKYPSGKISEQAQAVLERLAASKIQAVPDRNGMLQVRGAERFRVGDLHALRVMDGFTKVARSVRNRVTSVTDTQVVVGNGDLVLTPEGATVSNRNVALFDPPRLDLPAGDYVVGKKWSYTSFQRNRDGKTMYAGGSVRIAALEEVTVPAGTFKAYRLELEGGNDNGGQVHITRWMRPEWGFPIKELIERSNGRGGRESEILEMTEPPRRN